MRRADHPLEVLAAARLGHVAPTTDRLTNREAPMSSDDDTQEFELPAEPAPTRMNVSAAVGIAGLRLAAKLLAEAEPVIEARQYGAGIHADGAQRWEWRARLGGYVVAEGHGAVTAETAERDAKRAIDFARVADDGETSWVTL